MTNQKELSGYHGNFPGTFRIPDEFPEPSLNLDVPACQETDYALVDFLTDGCARQSCFASTSPLLKFSDEMEVTELMDPSEVSGDLLRCREVVGN